jgi:hypothetical protein
MVIVKQQKIASEEWLTYASAFLAPSPQQSPPQESKQDLSQETKGEARRKNRKNKEPTNENNGTDKKRIRIESKAFMAYSGTRIAEPLIDLFKMNPHQHQRSRHSQRRIKTTETYSPRSQTT